MPKVVLSASGISKRFGSNVAVDRVSLDVQKGEILGLLGPNGAGKSTLAKILAGLLKADSGKIKYFGKPVEGAFSTVKKAIAMVPQESSFYHSFTVRQNILFFASLYGAGQRAAAKNVAVLMKWLQLERFSGRKAEHLSGGYKRLLNIACSLVNDPQIIFMDEPTVGLDPKMRQLLWDKISELRGMGKTILLTTHYMDEAEELCDRVALMSTGKIAVIEDPRALIGKYGGETVLIFKLDRNVELDLIVKIKAAMPKTVVRSAQSNMIIAVKQAKSTKAIVRLSKIIEEAGYEIRGSVVKEPELEDVFLALTGREIKEEQIVEQEAVVEK